MATAADPASDTIFALSSGRLPAAIAVMRVSGPDVAKVLTATIGKSPPPRRASLRIVRDPSGEPIDRALVIRFPAPNTATGEDVAEFHFHGSRAVVAAAATTFTALGCREAEPGEFTRRALLAGRIDLAETEALADLLEAETESQRRDAYRRANGDGDRAARYWIERLTALSATVEFLIDHDEDDGDPAQVYRMVAETREEVEAALAAPTTSRIRDGIRVVLAGPPNAGKSSLFNRILGSDAAIVSPTPGTTRDVNERSISIDGIAYVLVDTAGARDAVDEVEKVGVARARAAAADADIVLDLGDESETSGVRIPVAAQADRVAPAPGRIATSAVTGVGIDVLMTAIVVAGEQVTRSPISATMTVRERASMLAAVWHLRRAEATGDLAVTAGAVRAALQNMLDVANFVVTDVVLAALFSRFCVGK